MIKHNKLFEYGVLSYIGGTTYVTMEVFARQYSHWSMFICGMLCFIGIGLINKILPWSTPIWIQMVIGGFGIVTPLEFITGCIVNIQLGWHVWNYTCQPNILGQISLKSSIGWCFLSLIGILLDDYIRYWFFNEQKPKYIFLYKKGIRV